MRSIAKDPVCLQLHGNRILCSPTPSEAELLSVMQEPPDGMILTISKNAAAVINRIAVNNFFSDMQPCGEVSFDNGESLQPIYHGMKVIKTEIMS